MAEKFKLMSTAHTVQMQSIADVPIGTYRGWWSDYKVRFRVNDIDYTANTVIGVGSGDYECEIEFREFDIEVRMLAKQ